MTGRQLLKRDIIGLEALYLHEQSPWHELHLSSTGLFIQLFDDYTGIRLIYYHSFAAKVACRFTTRILQRTVGSRRSFSVQPFKRTHIQIKIANCFL